MNEEVSAELLYSAIEPLIESSKTILLEIINNSLGDFNDILSYYTNQSRKSGSLVQRISDCPYSAVGLERFAEDSLIFVNRVDRIIQEILIYAKQGDTPKSLVYWNNQLIKNAIEAAIKLNRSYRNDFWAVV
ncbi:hypothetical protein SDC9_189974 [bioreactor metagenome]|uniref:Uncharacterized protein n=1 Tax=bioreactor metagenome TaxID=1076179 RepID=A0A645HTW4_9ZZZZ